MFNTTNNKLQLPVNELTMQQKQCTMEGSCLVIVATFQLPDICGYFGPDFVRQIARPNLIVCLPQVLQSNQKKLSLFDHLFGLITGHGSAGIIFKQFVSLLVNQRRTILPNSHIQVHTYTLEGVHYLYKGVPCYDVTVLGGLL